MSCIVLGEERAKRKGEEGEVHPKLGSIKSVLPVPEFSLGGKIIIIIIKPGPFAGWGATPSPKYTQVHCKSQSGGAQGTLNQKRIFFF